MVDSGLTHTCTAGETFDSIALTEYQDEKYAADLLCMNPEYCRITTFVGGEILLLPEITVPENEIDGEYDPGIPITPPWKE